MKKYIGVDIGGMSVKIGLVNENGNILDKKVVKTDGDAESVICSLGTALKEFLANNNLTAEDIEGIGIGCPGAITAATGVVEYSNNLGWHKVPLIEGLRAYVDTYYKISNDANVAALGEAIFGAAKEYSDVVMFTLGTGVGGGIIIDKKLYEGNESKGAELGHALLVLDGEQCTCGRKGCIEAYCSASALIRDTKRAMLRDTNSKMWEYANNDINNVNGRTAFAMARENDAAATEVVENYVKYLSESIMSYCNIFRPQAFVLGGGICGEGRYLLDKVEKYCIDGYYGYQGTPAVKILTATLGNDAGIIGAAALLV
ncbi:MAG: glucokinase [Bacillota bacterium]|nr:MAG: glucokinase [Bacillota bacterium]